VYNFHSPLKYSETSVRSTVYPKCCSGSYEPQSQLKPNPSGLGPSTHAVLKFKIHGQPWWTLTVTYFAWALPPWWELCFICLHHFIKLETYLWVVLPKFSKHLKCSHSFHNKLLDNGIFLSRLQWLSDTVLVTFQYVTLCQCLTLKGNYNGVHLSTNLPSCLKSIRQSIYTLRHNHIMTIYNIFITDVHVSL
jgi:hypothetical protein